MIICKTIGDLEHAFCSPYNFLHLLIEGHSTRLTNPNYSETSKQAWAVYPFFAS